MGTLKTITAYTERPVNLKELKYSLRVDDDAQNDELIRILKAAVESCEKFLDIKIMSQVVELVFNGFPADSFSLQVSPIQSIDSIKYDNTASPKAEITLVEGTDYVTDTDSLYGRVKSLGGWPSTTTDYSSVRIRMTVGYANAAAVPHSIKQGVMLYAKGIYDQCEDTKKMAESFLWQNRQFR